VTETFSETTLQLWFPSEDTEEHFYKENAGFTSGTVMAPIGLPATLGELRARIVRLQEERRELEGLSCFVRGLPILGLIASRHHRTPVIPAYWQGTVGPPPTEDESIG
jgi:Cys-tRNA synthase (O-phospho-L-seryl-tRNA:Cys-tRNA synthase)